MGTSALALRSAAWHLTGGVDLARAEALEVAASSTDDPDQRLPLQAGAARLYAAEGEPWAALRCHRARIAACAQRSAEPADGVPAIMAIRDEALALLDVVEAPEAGILWERAALADQLARALAGLGLSSEALDQLHGVAANYRAGGDEAQALVVSGTRLRLLADLDRAEEGLEEATAAAEAALAADLREASFRLGQRLAQTYADLDRDDEADAAWERFAQPFA